MFVPRSMCRQLFGAALVIGLGALPASASSISVLPIQQEAVSEETSSDIVQIAHRKCPPNCLNYNQSHNKFHKRYHRKHRHFDQAHRHFHRHHRKHHIGPIIYFGLYRDFYDPYYYDPFYYGDPYWYAPSYVTRLSCGEARRVLRRHGYRNVKAYDCNGKTYGFYATKNNKRFKVKVRSRDGQIVSRLKY